MKKVKVLLMGAVLLFAVAIVATACTKPEPETNQETKIDEISVRLPIPVIEAAQTPFYVAEQNGYYKDENLKVSFNLGGPENNPVKMVAMGADDFGVLGGPDTLLVANDKGQDLVAVSIIHRNSNFSVLITLKDSGITKLEQLQGKKIGFFYGHISTDVLRSLLNKFHIKYKAVDVGFDYSQLITKKLDAQWAFTTTAGVNLPAKGIEINTISPADYGIVTQGYTIFVSRKTLEEKPELIERFLRATFKGIKYTLDNPEKAIDALMAKNEKLNKDLELKRLYLYNKVTSNSTEYPIGYMDYDMFAETYNRLKEGEVIKNDLDLNQSFDLQFLKKIYGEQFNNTNK